MAIAGLILGLLSPAALAASLLWLLPPLGVIVNVIALRREFDRILRTGRMAAIIGLALSVIFGVAPPVETATIHSLLAWQGRPVADQWFEYPATQPGESHAASVRTQSPPAAFRGRVVFLSAGERLQQAFRRLRTESVDQDTAGAGHESPTFAITEPWRPKATNRWVR